MAFVTSPNMSLTIPVVGQETGPQYATDVNNCMTTIDGHSHVAGSGVLITPAAINLSADLPFLNNNATQLRSVNFTPQGAPLALAADIGCIYVSGVDLYYNDVSGNQIRLTQSGSIVGTAGSIGGLPSGTASASYALGTFTFQSATLTAANIDAGSYIFRNGTPSSFGLTLQPPNAMGADYSVTLPPPSNLGIIGVLTYDVSNNIGFISYDALGESFTTPAANQIAANMDVSGVQFIVNTMVAAQADQIAGKMTVTGANTIANTMNASGANQIAATMNAAGVEFITNTMDPVDANVVVQKTTKSFNNGSAGQGNVLFTNSTGGFTTTSTGYTPIESGNLTSNGRPVMVYMLSDRSGTPAACANVGGSGFQVRLRNSTSGQTVASYTGGPGTTYPVTLVGIDNPGAGVHTYVLEALAIGGTTTIQAYIMMAYELD